MISYRMWQHEQQELPNLPQLPEENLQLQNMVTRHRHGVLWSHNPQDQRTPPRASPQQVLLQAETNQL